MAPARRLGQPAVAAVAAPVRAPPPPPARGARAADTDDDDDGPVVPARRPAHTGSVKGNAAPPVAAATTRGEEGSGDDEDDVVVCTRRHGPPAAAAGVAAAAAAPLRAAAAAGPLRPPSPPRVMRDGYSVDPAAAPHDPEALAMLPGGYGLPMRIFSALYPYQRAGVAWMWSLHPDSPHPLLAAGEGEGGEEEEEEEKAGVPARAAAAGAKICGAVLADDMGLGKTAQTIAYVAGLFHSERAELVLVVAPLSVLPVWEAELARWAPEVVRYTFHGQASESARRKLLTAAQQSGGVVLTTYGLLTSAAHVLGADPAGLAGDDDDGDVGGGEGDDDDDGGGDSGDEGFKRKPKKAAAAKPKKPAPARAPRKPAAPKQRVDVTWDLVVTDEGHKLKNASTLVAKAARALPSRARLLLSGTPMPNNLDELWSLFDYVGQGALLGTRRTFNRLIGDRIVASRDRHATVAEKRDGHLATQQLQRTIAPYLLRREKSEVFAITAGGSDAAGAAATAAPDDVGALATRLAGVALGGEAGAAAATAATDSRVRVAMGVKKELVLWTRPSALQLALYTQHLGSADVDAAVRRTGSPLAAITVMRQISAHPLLLKPSHALWASVAARQPALAATLLAPAGLPLGGTAGSSSSSSSSSGGGGDVEQAVDDEDALLAQNQLDVTTRVVEDEVEEDEQAAGAAAAAGARAPPPQQLPLPPAAVLVAMSGKLATLVALLRLLVARQHKVLIFSQSKRMLDLLGVVLRALYCPSLDCALRDAAAATGSGSGGSGGRDGSGAVGPHRDEEEEEEVDNGGDDDAAGTTTAGGGEEEVVEEGAASVPLGVRFVRIDGDVPMQERRAIVEAFNGGGGGGGGGGCSRPGAPGPRVCLLTTGVGALGLTLTSADRVIITDPSWNPSVDSQSVDRAYRLGQTRDVVTYRLISCGTVEERQYGRQLFKGGLERSVLTGGGASGAGEGAGSGGAGGGGRPGGGWVAPSRIMSQRELKELFSLGATATSDTAARLAMLSAPPPVRSPAIAAHLAELMGASAAESSPSAPAGPSPPRRRRHPLPPPPISALVASLSHHDHLLDLRVSDRDAQEAGAATTATGAAAGQPHPRGASAGSGSAATPAAPRTLRKAAAAAAGERGAPSSPGTPPTAGYGHVGGVPGDQRVGPVVLVVDLTTPAAAAQPAPHHRAVVVIEDTPSAAAAEGAEDEPPADSIPPPTALDFGGHHIGAAAAAPAAAGATAAAEPAAPLRPAVASPASAGGGSPAEEDVDATRVVDDDGDSDDESDSGATRLARADGVDGGDDVDGVMGQLALSPVFAPSGRPSRRSLAFAPPPLQLPGSSGDDDGGAHDDVPLSPILDEDGSGGDGSGPWVAPRTKKGLSLGPEEAAALRRLALAEVEAGAEQEEEEAEVEEEEDHEEAEAEAEEDHDDDGGATGGGEEPEGGDAASARHQALLDEALAFIEAHEGAPQPPPGMAAMQLQAMQAAAALGLM